jgi:hypothetical protein
MGNLTSADFPDSSAEDDKAFLALQSTAFFNDAYINNVVDDLPLYGFPKADASDPSTEEKKTVSDDNTGLLQNLLAVLSSDSEQKSNKVEDYDLSVNEAIKKSSFHSMGSNRNRVLLRVFQVSLH